MSPSEPNPGKNIDQIRDLIFGEQIRDYDRRFKTMEKKLDSLRSSFEQAASDWEKRYKQQEAYQKEQFDSFQKQIKEVDSRIKKWISKIESQCEKLQEDKTDRLELANLLMEISLRLKREDLLDQLTGSSQQAANESG